MFRDTSYLRSEYLRLEMFLATATLMIFVVGCGKSHPETYPVSGTVTFVDGKPIANVTVEFESTASKPAVTARGKTDENGQFVLSTYLENDGAVPGKHLVSVLPIDNDQVVMQKEEREKPSPAPNLHPKYSRGKSSGLSRTVESSVENHFDFQLDYNK